MKMSLMNNYAFVIGGYLGGNTNEALLRCSTMREKESEVEKLIYLCNMLWEVRDKSEIIAEHLTDKFKDNDFVTTLDTNESYIK